MQCDRRSWVRHFYVKFELFEKGTKFEKIFQLICNVKFKVEDFFKFFALLKKTELYFDDILGFGKRLVEN